MTLRVPVLLLLAAMGAAAAPPVRAMWVWDAEGAPDLVPFCRTHGITELFLQYSPSMPAEKLRALLRGANQAGVRVHALDGFPEAAMPANHNEVLATVRRILDFNQSAAPDERFYGIHLDNEPYLLLGHDSPFKETIYQGYLELNRKIRALLQQRRATVQFGVDIPFWFRDDIVAGLLPLVDNIGIMDYRNKAEGSDGFIEYARPPIAAANRLGKRVYIGVETGDSPASDVVFLHGIPETRWSTMTVADLPLLAERRFEGFSLHSHSVGGWRFVGLTRPDKAEDLPRFRQALLRLEARLGVKTSDCRDALRREPPLFARGEYRGYQPFPLTDAGCAQAFASTSPALPKITFHGLTMRDLERELAATAKALAAEPAFYGFAIHHFDSYKQLSRE